MPTKLSTEPWDNAKPPCFINHLRPKVRIRLQRRMATAHTLDTAMGPPQAPLPRAQHCADRQRRAERLDSPRQQRVSPALRRRGTRLPPSCATVAPMQTSPTLSARQALLCGTLIVTLSMGIRHGFERWLLPLTPARD